MSDSKIVKLPTRKSSADETAMEKRWGKAVYNYGYTVVPSILLQGQRRLGLSAMQMNVLLQLLDHWWKDGHLPHPSKNLIAERLDVTPRYVQKKITELENAGFLRRISRKSKFGDPDTNSYDLSGTVKKLQSLEPEFSKVRREKRRIQTEVETPKGRRRK